MEENEVKSLAKAVFDSRELAVAKTIAHLQHTLDLAIQNYVIYKQHVQDDKEKLDSLPEGARGHVKAKESYRRSCRLFEAETTRVAELGGELLEAEKRLKEMREDRFAEEAMFRNELRRTSQAAGA